MFSFKHRFNGEGRLVYVGERWYPMLSGNRSVLKSLVSGSSKTQVDTSCIELLRFMRDKTVHANEKLRSNSDDAINFRILFNLSDVNDDKVDEADVYTELKIALLAIFPMVPSIIYRVRSYFPNDQTLSRALRSKFPTFELREKEGYVNAAELNEEVGLVEEIAFNARGKGDDKLERQLRVW